MEEQHEDHGHSTAAWTGVGIILLGTAIASIGVIVPSLLLAIIGAVVIVAGVAAGKTMSMAGYGNNGHHAFVYETARSRWRPAGLPNAFPAFRSLVRRLPPSAISPPRRVRNSKPRSAQRGLIS